MSAQHASAPWAVVETPSGEIYVRNAGGLIAQGPRPTRYEGQDQRYKQELLEYAANARLIAAAPDLLAALRYALEYVDEDAADMTRINPAIDAATGVGP